MLAKVIQSTEMLCNKIRSLKDESLVINQLQAHTTSLQSSTLEKLRNLQTELESLVKEQQRNISIAQEKIDNNSSPLDIKKLILESLLKEVQDISKKQLFLAQSIGSELSNSRDILERDSQAIAKEQIHLSGKQEAIRGRIENLQKRHHDIQKRISVINGVSIVFPIAKLASELANLIKSKKTTEQELADSANEISHLHSQVSQIHTSNDMIKTLMPLVSQTDNSIQGIINTISLIAGKVKNENILAQTTNEETIKLFLLALDTSFDQLSQEIS